MEVEIPLDQVVLAGDLVQPEGAGAMVIFAHGSGSSRHSVRNQMVARKLQAEGYSTLLFDLLTAGEDQVRDRRFDIGLISDRLVAVTRWLQRVHLAPGMPVGYFGASTGAAAALVAAARLKDEVRAVVSRGGRPDLAGDSLEDADTPVLLIVGGRDEPVIRLNEQSFPRLPGIKKMIIIEGAGHLFEEDGKLEAVAVMAVQWFNEHLRGIPVKG